MKNNIQKENFLSKDPDNNSEVNVGINDPNNNHESNVHSINLPNKINYPMGKNLNNSNTNNKNNLSNNSNNKYNVNDKESSNNNNNVHHQNNNSNNSNQNGNTNNENDANTPDKSAKKRVSGRLLIMLIAFVLIYEYYTYIFLLHPLTTTDLANFKPKFFAILFFHILLFMMLWCFIVTMKTIPGEIPLYWGFYIGDEEYKRKRYCLICNAFKPERSHHCSVCNKCVLNMDHHCPWVNNCIGFYNRKFFMQLLFYLLILLWFIILSSISKIYEIIHHCYTTKFHITEKLAFEYLLILPAFAIVCVLTVLNSMFFKYHVGLVLSNSTTIESLDTNNNEYLKFKLTYSENWAQVFGFDTLLWFFPVFSEAGRPNGDGLNWKISPSYE